MNTTPQQILTEDEKRKIANVIADLRGKETVAMVRSLSMVGLVPVRVSQLVSLFIPYPAFSAMPT